MRLIGLVDNRPQTAVTGPVRRRMLSDFLDISVTRNIDLPIELSTIQEGPSDNNPVINQIGDPNNLQADQDESLSKEFFHIFRPLCRTETRDEIEDAIQQLEDSINKNIGVVFENVSRTNKQKI